MKKGKVLLITAIISLFVPFVVNAKEAANIYIFKGKTCSYCAKALEFFEELKEDKDYQDKFNLVQYEIWYNEGNEELANDVAEKLGDDLDGVPYIVIGEQTFSGYTSSYDDAIKAEIDEYYEEENREDVVAELLSKNTYSGIEAEGTDTNGGTTSSTKESNADTIIAIAIIIIAVVGFGYVIYLSRKDTSVPESKKSVPQKEVKKTQENVEKETPKQTTKKKTVKKTTSSKKTTKK